MNSAPKNEELRGRNDTRNETWPTAERGGLTNTYIGKASGERSRPNNPNSDTSILPKEMNDRKHLSAPKHKYKGELHLPSFKHSHSLLLHLSLPHTPITLTVDLFPPLHSIRDIHLVLARYQHRIVKHSQIARHLQHRQAVRCQSRKTPAEKQTQSSKIASKRVSKHRVRLSRSREPTLSSEDTRSR